MEKRSLPKPNRGAGQQTFTVDGHKVMIRYSERENSSAIKAIQSTLIAGMRATNS